MIQFLVVLEESNGGYGVTTEQADKLLRAAGGFQGQSFAARELSREQFRRAEPEQENTLRILIDGQIALIGEKVTQRVEAPSSAISYQIGVSASFIRTHFIVSDLIPHGDLVEAMTLIRKQLESLARLHELDSRPLLKLSGKVPNIQNILKGASGRMYGNLSEVAHFSTPQVSELLHVLERGELVGPSLLPVFTQSGFACFDMVHFVALYFLAWMLEKLPQWYPGYDSSEDRVLLGETVVLAREAGVVRLPEAASP